jgi:phosphoribosylaminoimidazole (AIR) synthetase
MGIGMILVVSPEDTAAVRQHFSSRNEPCYEIGSIVEGNQTVRYN